MNSRGSIADVVEKKTTFFLTDQPKSIKFCLEKFRELKISINLHEKAIFQALKADLGKLEVEAFTSEIVLVNQEIEYAIKHLKTSIRPKNTKIIWQRLPALASIYSAKLE